ncbi:pentatricopeptide repeat-containing protein At4g38010 [Ziziphus jujuba]|uniref:Pentatricopeptide repeat-containing protein At4g38010 n=3 Tax=Ziziphus jujuba TaxID=326968 RepID=A0A6P3ZRL6_ZIZJJ|nr:pentatricopeptide repeat-containing protein At4g38010 [Ziziphus jujuba]XP_015878069.3 pentatricopeptide repeat-containing protein At4g38010 [Ziziphus jujuba]XP_060675638.1 pentatricopeptide repeat-containing protein At4g38010 [Ziziphus jujuba]
MSIAMCSVKWVLLNSIRRCNNLKFFKQIHAQLLTTGLIYDSLFANYAVEYFGKSVGIFDYACDYLKQLDWRLSSFPFNVLISRYAGGNTPREAVWACRRLRRDGFVPDMFTFPAVLKSCTKFLGIGEGRQVHGVVITMGFCSDVYVQNSLLHFYGVCGDCDGASRVFDDMLVRDVVSWTGLISGFVRVGLFEEAVALFLKMDVEPNIATFVTVLVASGRIGCLSVGKATHGLILKRAMGSLLAVGNAIMDMYVKCEHLFEAKQVFYELPEKDIVSWTCMISGLVQCKHPKESLELFWNMQNSGIEPDEIILTSVLSACASLGALDHGRWVHEYIDRMGIKWDIHIGTSMIDMYAKCGSIKMALQVFNDMPSRNVLTWNALLGGLATHGLGHEALKQFEEMTRSSTRPNEVTFLAILTACCHCGLVDEGRWHFYQMISEPYNLSPRLEHYGCVVDLLCRAGILDEALKLIKTMPMKPDVLMWGALLSACKATGNVELSQEILDRLLDIESKDSGAYVLLSNIYATNKRWDDVTRVRWLMKEKGLRKTPGSSVIEVNGKPHEFLAGDTRHLRIEDIHVLLYFLDNQVRLQGRFITHS